MDWQGVKKDPFSLISLTTSSTHLDKSPNSFEPFSLLLKYKMSLIPPMLHGSQGCCSDDYANNQTFIEY